MTISTIDRYRGALLGLAAGDALGTTLEFTGRLNPYTPKVTDIIGGGPFGLNAGDFTDDGSMALCLAESLVARQDFDPVDQMRRYVRWHDDGENSVKGYCFDIGGTTSAALRRFKATGRPYAGVSDGAGNGSLMRLAPAPMAARTLEEAIHYSGLSSKTTHGAPEAIDACRAYGVLIFNALHQETNPHADKLALLHSVGHMPVCAGVESIIQGSYRTKTPPEIRGTGYVLKSMEAALWAFYHGTDFKSTVILAANLGEDADTTAACSGQLAGAWYGVQDIPARWRKIITWNEKFIGLADQLHAMSERAVD